MGLALGVVVWAALDDITTGNESDLWLEWMVVGVALGVVAWLFWPKKIDKRKRNK